MKPAPKKCIVCNAEGEQNEWNNMEVLRCPNCGLAWRSKFDITANYYIDLHTGEGDVDKERVVTRLHNAEDRLISLKKFLPRNGVCDIGCGDGSFLSVLRNNGYQECWGIEPSVYACASALEKKLDVVTGNLSNLQHAKEGRSFKACTLFHVIEHVPDPLEVLQVLRDALPLGGIVIIETPDADAAIQKATNHKNALIYHEHLFYWTEKSLHMALEQNGFKVVQVSRRSFDWRHSSVQSSLMRLGWRFNIEKRKTRPHIQARPGTAMPIRLDTSLLRMLVRTILVHLVHMLGRDDYLLVVAKRSTF